MKNVFKTIVSLSLVLCLGCAGNKSRLKVGESAQGEVVESEGLAPNNVKDLILTKRASLLDAQKNAIEKVVGVFVSGKTMVEKAVAIENNILANTQGYIKKYDILSEGPEGDFYKTKIRALVSVTDLQKDLQVYSNEKLDVNRPLLSVSIAEQVDNEPIEEAVAQAAFESALQEQGFKVTSSTPESGVVIVGKANSSPFQAEGLGGFTSYRARLSVSARRTSSKENLLSMTKEASGLGGNNQLAGYKSLETVGRLVGSDVATQLNELFKRGGVILVFVEGVNSFQDVQVLKKHLSSQPDVKDCKVNRFEEHMAEFDVATEGISLDALASRLEASQSLPLKVLEAKNGMLRMQWKDGAK